MEAIRKGLREFDDSEVYPIIRERLPSPWREGLDAYSSSRSHKVPQKGLLQALAGIKYHPLPVDKRRLYIRLLRLSLPKSQGRIQCELEHHCLDSAPGYWALSYCWGCEDANIPIVCDGAELLVTRAVASALFRMRLRGCKYLWIDALCINQTDLAERQQQVGIMQKIYRNAAEVCVWLGGERDQFFGSSEGSHKGTFRCLRQYARYPEELVQESTTVLRGDLRRTLQLPWFDRVWCVQEVMMNSRTTVICGPDEISWHTFCAGLKAAVEIEQISSKSLRAVSRNVLINKKLASLARYESPSAHDNAASYLLKLLHRYHTKLSSDPRDKVYALYGVVKHHFDDFVLESAYDIPYGEAYKNTTSYILRKMQNLDVLALCDGRKSSRHSPAQSWVPDWSCIDHLPAILERAEFDAAKHHSISSSSKRGRAFDVYEDSLRLQGHILDCLEDVGDILPLDEIPEANVEFELDRDVRDQKYDLETSGHGSLKEVIELWRAFKDREVSEHLSSRRTESRDARDDGSFLRQRMKFIVRQTLVCLGWKEIALHTEARDRYENKERREAAYLQTLSAGQLHENLATTCALYSEWDQSLKLLKDAVDRENNLKPLLDVSPVEAEQRVSQIEPKWNQWQRKSKFAELLRYAYNRRFARTSKDYFSLVPASAQKGDFVGVFAGSDVPLVIREFGEEWKLVGQCYVQGIMNGDAFSTDKCKAFLIR